MAEKDPLEPFFEAAREEVPPLDDALMNRMIADAAAVAAARAPAASIATTPAWRRVFVAIGGWPALAGLASATAAGVWIGVALPDLATPYAAQTEASVFDLTDLLPGYGQYVLEEG